MTRSFTVPGEPRPKGRPRFFRGRVYTPARTQKAEQHIRDCYKEKYGEETFPEKTPLRMVCIFYMGIPKSASKKKREEMEGTPCTKRPDCDNMLKACADSLNGAAFTDDSLLVELMSGKYWSTEPRTEITLETL